MGLFYGKPRPRRLFSEWTVAELVFAAGIKWLCLAKKKNLRPLQKLKQKEQTLGHSVCFGPRSLVCVDLAKACHSVSPAASGTASKIGGEGRFQRRSCSLRSSSSVAKSDRELDPENETVG
jgi:hypothetical protein